MSILTKKSSRFGTELENCPENGDGKQSSGNEPPHSNGAALILQPQTVGSPLDAGEQLHREKCEHVIRNGLATFLEVGQALATIRNKRLYRDFFTTFEDYCRQKWEISKSHANRMIEAAVVVSILTPIGAKPSSESQIRPLVGLAPQKIPDAWNRAKELAGSGEITAKVVRQAAEEFKPASTHDSEAVTGKSSPKKRTPLASALDLIDQIEKKVKKSGSKAVLKDLAKLREHLCVIQDEWTSGDFPTRQ
jgi:hypothetical protein